MARRPLLQPLLVSQLIPAVLRRPDQQADPAGDQLLCCWAAAAGQLAARHTLHVQLRAGTLRVDMVDPGWAQRLQPLKGALLQRLRRMPGLGGVEMLQLGSEHPGRAE
ncbi:MAG: DUF721 domain-containing protein [Deltaproteobacteria bacterium]|nr:DUF721 domain-containing protein [Deltaproteobacteria bacterium]